jgi:DNA polymerase iota
MESSRTLPPTRKDGRIIIHFDYDAFYCSVFEHLDPSLRRLPFAVQQKQIIVTCNYVARAKGLHKLQLIRDARRICPEVIIKLGEDISVFRDASKTLYKFIESFTWNGRVERLGFDEVWMDVTDVVEWNLGCLNKRALEGSWFQTRKDNPEDGFAFDATGCAGHTYPAEASGGNDGQETEVDDLTLRLRLGSHLAMHIRHQLEHQHGYTATVGIATNKLLSKLVGNLHKPKDQTTIMPTPSLANSYATNAQSFIDTHEIGKIPGIGFKLSQLLRAHVLARPGEIDTGLVYGGTKENVTVLDVRTHPDISPEKLDKLLAGPGSAHGIGAKVWGLLHGVDDSEVGMMRTVPRQISIEDSYIRLDTYPELLKELEGLARSLLGRMRVDLLGEDEDEDGDSREAGDGGGSKKIWLAYPKTLRLTTRPRQALLPDGTRPRSFKRISHSAPLPSFVFSLSDSVNTLATKLLHEALIPMFRHLHPAKQGWNLSLVNLAVTNMVERGGEGKGSGGRDIARMMRRQEGVLKDFRVTDFGAADEQVEKEEKVDSVVDDVQVTDVGDGVWDDGEDDGDEVCGHCGLRLPEFAMVAHSRFHELDVG